MDKKQKIDLHIKSFDDHILVDGSFSGGDNFILQIMSNLVDSIMKDDEEGRNKLYLKIAILFTGKALGYDQEYDMDLN